MKNLFFLFAIFLIMIGCQSTTGSVDDNGKTFCNPVNISYRFTLDNPSRREAADPTIIWFKDRYYLFASKSGGYWHSKDLSYWTFVETNEIPTEEYAPTAIVLNDTIYFLASSTEQSTIYKSGDPLSGKWEIAVERLEIPVWDPAFFLDDDNCLYLFWGCSNANPLYGVEVDYKNNFTFIGSPAELIHANPKEHGWEVPGDYNTLTSQAPWIEGAWVTKKNGRYYLQYSGPGTEFKSYADGMYISDNPLGPFTLQAHNPFVYKPEGFAAGAGHGSLFADQYGNAWHIGTITISQKHMFERRLGIYPAFYDEDGTLYSITKYADYPLMIPTRKVNGFDDIFPGWMLLSYRKNVEVSSSVDSLSADNIADEDIRTYWAAQTGNEGEYAVIDLGDNYDVNALQVNFADHNTQVLGRKEGLAYKYKIEKSVDGSRWDMLVDQSGNDNDNTHAYFQLEKETPCRYLKITNIEVPDGNFALSGFRVFGKGHSEKPRQIDLLTAIRNNDDRRSVTLTWPKSENATGYAISFGSNKDKLYHNYMVYGNTEVTINVLDVNQGYYFTIEAFNENGITKSGKVLAVE